MKIKDTYHKGNKCRNITFALPILTLIIFCISFIMSMKCGAQMISKQLTLADYVQWGELINEKTSSNGKWISYRMIYENAKDTLFVRNIDNQVTFSYPNCTFPRFAGNRHFICQDSKNLYITDLVTSKREVYSRETQADFSLPTNQMVLFSKKENSLEFVNLSNNSKKTIPNTVDFSMSPNGKEGIVSIATDKKYSIGIISLTDFSLINWIAKDKPDEVHNFTWEEKGRGVAFYSSFGSDDTDVNLYFYNMETQQMSELNSKSNYLFPSNKLFDKNMAYPITISPDLKKVFFGLLPRKNITEKKANDAVEVWHTADKWIYPKEQRSGLFDERAILTAWQPAHDRIIPITTNELPKVILTGDKTYAIISNPKQYEPQFEIEAPRDYYLMNLNTGEKEILLKNQNEFYPYLLPSPSGKYIAYYTDENWWIYNIELKTHINITKGIPVPFFGRVYILASDSAYGLAGWSTNDQEILVYDQYDIWAIKPNGTSSRRLTDGREKGISFRFNTLGSYDLLDENFDGWKSKNINLDDEQILRAEGIDGKTGYYGWNRNYGTKQIVYTDSYLDNFIQVKGQKLFIYQQQQFDLPPRIMAMKNNSSAKIIFQSNAHHKNYQWGTSKLITYRNSKGKELQGILYFPSNYNPRKKYPMIVYIYEKQSPRVHQYINPTLFSGNGFNESVMTTKGYFVLCPDIEHETGKVGENTVDCTVSATNYIIHQGIVDSLKIGLMGESFGGYETNFVITQTNVFAAAVSGGSIADLTSFYLTVGWDLNISDMTRFQSQQWRMGKTPFEDPDLYSKNSPVANASSINTPILIWAGKSDWHVNWNQSVEFYMALRRLGKPATMLLYPDEKHILMKEKNQKNLSVRINQWFDYYLKDEKPAEWLLKVSK